MILFSNLVYMLLHFVAMACYLFTLPSYHEMAVHWPKLVSLERKDERLLLDDSTGAILIFSRDTRALKGVSHTYFTEKSRPALAIDQTQWIQRTWRKHTCFSVAEKGKLLLKYDRSEISYDSWYTNQGTFPFPQNYFYTLLPYCDCFARRDLHFFNSSDRKAFVKSEVIDAGILHEYLFIMKGIAIGWHSAKSSKIGHVSIYIPR